MDRIHSTCSWNPLYIDSRTPCAWTLANAALLEMLGDADKFVEDVRFSTEGRCYVFDDGHGATVAAIWNANERFDRGLDEATTLRMADVEGMEVYDLYGNRCAAARGASGTPTGCADCKGSDCKGTDCRGSDCRGTDCRGTARTPHSACFAARFARGIPASRETLALPFSGYVVYLKVPNAKREELLKALRAATVDSDADKLSLSCGITLKSGTEADVRIENPLSREQAFAVRIGNAVEQSRRGVIGHDFDDFSYEIGADVAATNAVPHGTCYRRFAPDHQLTFGVSEHKFHHNVVVPEIPVKLNAKDGLVEYEVDFPVYYLKPLALEAGGVSPGLGIEYYDRDERKVFPRIKYTNDAYPEACKHPHTYPQLIFVK